MSPIQNFLEHGNPASSRRINAFTLLELMVVISVMCILMALVAPTFQGISKGNELTNGGQIVADQFALGRQFAASRNSEVQVRFFWVGNVCRGVQLWALSPNDRTVSIPVSRMEKLPDGVTIANTTSLSPLASGTTPTIPLTGGTFTSVGSAQYCGFRFRAGGMTDLPFNSTNNYLTIISKRDSGDTLPHNYSIVQVDPISGRSKIYRP